MTLCDFDDSMTYEIRNIADGYKPQPSPPRKRFLKRRSSPLTRVYPPSPHLGLSLADQQDKKDACDRINAVQKEWENMANLQDTVMDDVEGLWEVIWEVIAGPGKRCGKEISLSLPPRNRWRRDCGVSRRG